MHRFLLLLAITCSLARFSPAAEPPRATVVDYFLRLPAELFEVPPPQLLHFVKQPSCGVIDTANGYLSCIGDGAQPGFQIALFRWRDGRPLVAVCFDELEGPEAVDLDFYEPGKDGRLRKIGRKLLPAANAEGRSFTLPRHGRTIMVKESRKGAAGRQFTWDGERFVEGK